MGARLLPRNLPELFSYSLLLEREAARRYAELERFLRGHGASALAAEWCTMCVRARVERHSRVISAIAASSAAGGLDAR